MINLLQETNELLKQNNKTLNDIVWFGSKGIELQGDLEKALDFNYNDGFGSQNVLADLILVGESFWLERHEYDGSEWWEFKTKIKRPKQAVDLGIRKLDTTSLLELLKLLK